MSEHVYLSAIDAVVPAEEATVSVFDRGFLYGDSVFETLRTRGGRPVELARHLARLRASADGIGLAVPLDDAALTAVVRRTLAATGEAECRIRVMITRGRGPIALDPRTAGAPLLVVVAGRLELPSPEAYARGVHATIVELPQAVRAHPGLKTGNYLPSIFALRRAAEQGCDEAILCNAAGEIAEASASNVFWVADDRLETPALDAGVLSGITRAVVIELAGALGRRVDEVRVPPARLQAATEVFLTSSVRGLMPVTRLDARTVGSGAPGPVTLSLRAAYEQRLASVR
jgi:branched-chain amino acid aminotransferase